MSLLLCISSALLYAPEALYVCISVSFLTLARKGIALLPFFGPVLLYGRQDLTKSTNKNNNTTCPVGTSTICLAN
jgi:hypothetical protein